MVPPLQVRLIRQRRPISEDDRLELVAIVDEAALHREIGGPEVMRQQLRHLIEAAALPAVTLQVIQLQGAHSGMDGGFTLVEFPDPADQPLLYIEHTAGALHIEEPSQVREAKLVLDQLRTEALSPADSIELIEWIANELDRP